MKAKPIIAVGFRLYAIWLGVSALQLFLFNLSMLRQGAIPSAPYAYGITPWIGWATVAACGLVALFVWAMSGRMAGGLLTGFAEDTDGDVHFSRFDFIVVGCVLMGLWWLKESIVPVVGLWLKALAMSPLMGQSAYDWLAESGKVAIAINLFQIAIAFFFIVRARSIAKWALRHVPVIPDSVPEEPEPLDGLLRRAKELGLRQVATPTIVAKLIKLLASHPDAYLRLADMIELLRYTTNPLTRSASARTIMALGPDAADRAKEIAATQLADEKSLVVKNDLAALIALADGNQID